jgi:tetratricopeptide (TPR) repeat protein
VRNYVVGDDLVLVSSQGGANFYIGNGPGASGSFRVPDIFPATRADDPLQQEEAYRLYAEKETGRELKPSEISSFWYDRTWEHVGEAPGEWVSNLAYKLSLMFNYREIGNSRDLEASRDFSRVLRLPLPGFGLVGTLGLLGLVLAARRPRRAYFAYAMVGVYVVSLVIFFVLAHYRLPVVPFIAVFAGFAAVWFYDALRKRRLGALALAVAGLIAAAAFVNHDHEDVSENRFMIHYNLGNKYRLMGEWELAAREYKLSIEENPSYISAHNNLALAYENDPATYTEAIEVWETVLEMARQRRDGLYVERATRHLNRLRQITGRPGSQRPPRR